MKSSDKRELQKLIDEMVVAANAERDATDNLMEFCQKMYGIEPGDIDADEILDGVMGAAGKCDGMNAEEFDRIMKKG